MQFKLVMLGIVLLAAGLVAYSSVPNIHRTPMLATQSAFGPPEPVLVPSNYSVRTPINITIFPGKQNDLRVNINVTLPSGQLSSLHFQIFPKNVSISCSISQPRAFLVDRTVSNETFQTPINASGSHCLLFDNENSRDQKMVSIFVSVRASYEEVLIARDGGANMAGLGLGAFGFLVALYGVTRRTVVPWE